jgi:hypothetical protein
MTRLVKLISGVTLIAALAACDVRQPAISADASIESDPRVAAAWRAVAGELPKGAKLAPGANVKHYGNESYVVTGAADLADGSTADFVARVSGTTVSEATIGGRVIELPEPKSGAEAGRLSR